MNPVQLPRNVDTGARCHPLKLDIVLNRDLMSTAKMVIPEAEAVNFPLHSFVELYTQNGSIGVFRVISCIKTYGDSARIEMAHAIDTLSDSLAPVDEDFSGNVQQMLAKILSYQTTMRGGAVCWQLGTVADAASYETSLNYSNLYDLLEDLAQDQIDYQFSFDFSTSPWTLNFVARPTAIRSEFRLGRNISECTITRDDTELCTRLFLSVTTESQSSVGNESVTDEDTEVRTFDADTIGTWGIIQKTDSCTVKSADEANRYAARYLADHKNPTITIAIEGAELNRITGSTFDETNIGEKCRVALADYGETYEEHIVTVEYPDALNDPMRIKLTLANTIRSGSQTIAGNSKSTAANTQQIRSTSSTLNKSLIDIKQTDYMLYQAGIAYDAETGVFMFAQADGILGHALSFVDVTKEGGRAMFTDEFERDSSGKLIVKSASGMAYRKNNVQVGLFDNDNLTAGVLVERINTGETVTKILADKVDLGNYATVVNLEATNGRITNLQTGQAHFTAMHSDGPVTGSQGTFQTLSVGGAIWASKSMTGIGSGTITTFLGTADADLSHYHTVSFSDGKITIGGTTKTAPDPFDIAATTWYQNKIAAAKESVSVSIADSGWIINDASTGNYTREFTPQKDGVSDTSGKITISGQTVWQLGYNAGNSAGYSAGYAAGWSAAANGSGRSGNTVAYPSATQGVFDEATATAHLGGSMSQRKYSGATLYIQVATNVYQAYSGSQLYYAASDNHSASITWS